jgi:hypothetical protein
MLEQQAEDTDSPPASHMPDGRFHGASSSTIDAGAESKNESIVLDPANDLVSMNESADANGIPDMIMGHRQMDDVQRRETAPENTESDI